MSPSTITAQQSEIVTTTKTYDELNRVLTVDYPTDTDTSYTYDLGKIGTLSIATDSAGMVSYTYDNRLRKTSEARTISGTTKTTSYTYDALDRMTSQTNPDNQTVTYTHNNQGEIESVNGLVTDFDYNALGKITQKTFANGLTTDYTYNTDDFRLNRIQTGSVQDLSYTYDPVGNVASRTNNLTSKTELFSYDDLDRLKTASESAGYNYGYDYNSIGNLTKFTSGSDTTDYTYGSGASLPHALTASTASTSATTSTISLVQKKKGSGGGTGSVATSFDSNVTAGNLIVVMTITGSGSTLDTTSVTDSQGNTYTQLGTTQHTPGNNYIRMWYAKSVTGGSVTVTAHQSGSASGCLMEIFEYSGADTASPADQSASTTGNSTSPSGESITPSINGSLVLSAFVDDNTDGVSITGTSGYTVQESDLVNSTSTRNGIEDLVQSTATSTSGTWTTGSASDWAAVTVSFKPSVTGGAPTVLTTPVLVQKIKGSGGGTGTVATSLTSNVTSGDAIIVMTITGSGSNLDTTSVTDNQGNTYQQVGTTQHTPGNNYIRMWYAKNVTGGSVTVTAHQSGSASGCLMEVLEYAGLDATSPADQVASSTGNSTSPSGGSITPSSNNALILSAFVDDNSDSVSITGSTGYTVEESDLINSTSTRNGIEDTVQVTPSSQTGTWTTGSASDWAAIIVSFKPSSSTTYTYDANGNMTSDGSKLYEYNEANQLKTVKLASNSATLAEYVYDYNGLRMIKKNYTNGSLANTVTSWSESYETKDIVGGSTEATVYYYANGELIAKKSPDGSKFYYHNDHLHSTSVLTDENGDLVEETTYDPYGRVLSGGAASKFQYTGQEKDAETGLNYYDSRYYSSDIRRFVQPDSTLPNIYDPQQLNRYSYARNNPLIYTDPTGHAIVFQNGRLVSTIAGLPVPGQQQTKPAPSIGGFTSVLAASTSKSGSGGQPATTISNTSGGSATSSSSPQSPLIPLAGSVQFSSKIPPTQLKYPSINPFRLAPDYIRDPSAFPTGWVWKGKSGMEGTKYGAYENPITKEYLHRDVPHGEEGRIDLKGDHATYRYPEEVPYNGQTIDINPQGYQIDNAGEIIGEPIRPWIEPGLIEVELEILP